MMTPDLSIIIPAYNEEALILSTLDSLQTYLSTRLEHYKIIHWHMALREPSRRSYDLSLYIF